MSSITDKFWGIYKESKDIGLNVSLTVSICNGEETYVFKSVPSHGVTVISNRGRRQHGRGRGRRRGRANKPHEAPARSYRTIPCCCCQIATIAAPVSYGEAR